MAKQTNKPWDLQCGDSLRLLERQPDDSFHMVITDPAYCSAGSASQASSRKWYAGAQSAPEYLGETRDVRSWVRWMSVVLAECHRAAKDGAPLLVFSDWRMLPSLTDAVQVGGWIWRGIIPWNKGRGTRPRRGGFRSQCEFIAWATKGPIRDEVDVILDGCIEAHRRKAERELHQHYKPDELMNQLVTLVRPGERILDPFAGGCSTGAAAIRHGAEFVGMELSPDCARIARRHLRQCEREAAA